MLEEINLPAGRLGEIVEKPKASKKRRFLISLVIIFGVAVVLFGSLFGLGYLFSGKVLPNTFVGSLPVGSLKADELKSLLDNMDNKLSSEGLRFVYNTGSEEKTKLIYPILVEGDSTLELVKTDIDEEVKFLLSFGKINNEFFNGVTVLSSFFSSRSVKLHSVRVESEKLVALLADDLAKYETPAVDANVKVTSLEPLKYEIVASSPGIIYDYSGIIKEVSDKWSVLEPVQVSIKLKERSPAVLENEVTSIVSRLPAIFTAGPIEINYLDPVINEFRTWTLTEAKIEKWLAVQKLSDGKIVFGLNAEELTKFLKNNVSVYVDVPAVDAKFKVDASGKVLEFQGSRPGIGLDMEKTIVAINEIMSGRTWHDEGVAKTVSVLISTVEPLVKTGDVNELGIKDMLGVGVSDYSGSPSNRIKNITNAVNKLNGILIKPGEEFSTIKYTAPFTLEGGYFPELVIKGTELKPEIGGGLCQIATTLFRMSMNSGMKITSRRNHALVVSHYNDPVNHNPGTDATVYDPLPDFRFLNDTGNYILLQTAMNKKTQELVFTLWGTSDGRKGSYTHPVVLKWYSAGEPVTTETTTLKPGETKCQGSFPGADARFTYIIIRADNTKEEVVFDSHYKSVPKTCLKGVEVLALDVSASSTDVMSIPTE